MIPPVDPATGHLLPGVHEATWSEIVARYGGAQRQYGDQRRRPPVITNQRQYGITTRRLARFEQARAAAHDQGQVLPARQALRDQYDSQIQELRAQLAEYEALRTGAYVCRAPLPRWRGTMAKLNSPGTKSGSTISASRSLFSAAWAHPALEVRQHAAERVLVTAVPSTRVAGLVEPPRRKWRTARRGCPRAGRSPGWVGGAG